VKQFKSLFAMDNIELEFTDDALKEIVRETMSRKTGARGLRSVMEKTLQKAMFEMPGSGTKKLVVNAEIVKKGLEAPSKDTIAFKASEASEDESEGESVTVKEQTRRGRKKAS